MNEVRIPCSPEELLQGERTYIVTCDFKPPDELPILQEQEVSDNGASHIVSHTCALPTVAPLSGTSKDISLSPLLLTIILLSLTVLVLGRGGALLWKSAKLPSLGLLALMIGLLTWGGCSSRDGPDPVDQMKQPILQLTLVGIHGSSSGQDDIVALSAHVAGPVVRLREDYADE